MNIRIKLGKILVNVFKRERMFVFEHDTDICFLGKPKIKLKVDLIKEKDISEIMKTFKDFGKKAKERFKLGHLCFGAKTDGKYVHLKWVAFNESYISEIDRTIQISPTEAYLYDSYTLPEYRGLGLTSAVMKKTVRYLSDMGIKKIYAIVRHDNYPMLRVKEKEGARKIGTILYTKILGIKFYKIKAQTEEDRKKLTEMFLK